MGPKTQALVNYVREHPGCTIYDAAVAIWGHGTRPVATGYGTITRAVNAGHLIKIDGVPYFELYDGTSGEAMDADDPRVNDEPDQAAYTAYWQHIHDTARITGRATDHVDVANALEAADTARQARYQQDPQGDHADALASAKDNDDRPVYAWVDEGGISTGSLRRYAHAIEVGHYAGWITGDVLTKLMVHANGVSVTTETMKPSHEPMGQSVDSEGYPDHSYTRIVVRDEHGKIIDAADYEIDLRA